MSDRVAFSYRANGVQPLKTVSMGSVTYYVAMGFERSDEGDLVAMDPMESQSSSQAVSRARVLAAMKAGAVAFSRTGDPDIGEFADAVVLFTAGEVPDQLPTG